MSLSFPTAYQALIIGANGAIGDAFVGHLRADPNCAQVIGLSRSANGLDLEDPHSIEQLGDQLAERGPFHLIVDATGALTIDGVGPEKALSQLDHHALQRSMAINAIGPALLLKRFAKLLAGGDTIYAKLSARVGSIADNKKGGWYGYRASKAALNMLVKNLALELARTHPHAMAVTLHPGTVDTGLSAPFQRGVAAEKLFTPAFSAQALLGVLDGLTPADSGGLFAWDGAQVPF